MNAADLSSVPTDAVRATRRIRGIRALGVAGAVAAAIAVWSLATMAGGDLRVSFGPDQPSFAVTPFSVITTSLFAALAGWALLSLLERFAARARTVWTAAATGFTALSLAGPLSASASVVTKTILIAMHLIVAAVLIPTLRHTTR